MTPEGWRCWSCGAPAAPLVKCGCGAMVAVHSTRLRHDPSSGRAVDWMGYNEDRVTEYIRRHRSVIRRVIWDLLHR